MEPHVLYEKYVPFVLTLPSDGESLGLGLADDRVDSSARLARPSNMAACLAKGTLLVLLVCQAFVLLGGDRISFLGVRWTEHSRGVIRGGISNIRFVRDSVMP